MQTQTEKEIYMKASRILFAIIISFCFTLACDEPEYALYKDAAMPVEDRIKDLLPRMSLKEKIEQMGPGPLIRSPRTLLEYALSTGTSNTPDNKRLGIPGIKMADGPRGVRIKNATCFPVGMARGATWDPLLEMKVGKAIGAELKANGGNLLLAPTMNILRHPGWGRAQETYGEDTYHLGSMSVNFINGAQQHVMANAKHFALNSIEDTRTTIDVIVDERTLREIYLPHFKRVADAGVASFMSAYNSVNGDFCSQNYHLLREILKTEWNFDGFVVSDFLMAIHSTVPSVMAGCDVEMPLEIYYGPFLKNAVNHNKISEDVIDDSVKRILRQKFRFDLFDTPSENDTAVVESKEHTDLAREVALKSLVLLKNEEKALPLKKDEIHTIAVIGRYADKAMLGDGFPFMTSSVVTPSYKVSPLEGIINHTKDKIEVLFEKGEDEISMINIASKADVTIIIASLTGRDEGELIIDIPAFYGGDRDVLNLPQAQEKLIKTAAEASKKCIVVLEGGSAITMENWFDHVDAILMAWYPGMEGGDAIADILFGDFNPCGKLPITWPKSVDQLFNFGNRQKQVVYSYYHGYRYFEKENIIPRFPFGFGLSYTKFEYGPMELSHEKISKNGEVTISVDVTNTGKTPGYEIVQLYVGYQNSEVDRAVKDLKGFTKVHLDPSETKSVQIPLKAKDLAYYNVTQKSWEIEEIKYIVSIGASSEDIKSNAELSVENI